MIVFLYFSRLVQFTKLYVKGSGKDHHEKKSLGGDEVYTAQGE